VHAAQAIQDGDYDHPLEVAGRDEVAFLARTFDEMRIALRKHMDHLRNLDQMKSNFIAVAGHELKTPLTVISGFNDMIVSGLLGEIPEKVRETTELIQRRLQDLNRLVENILDMSRFDQGLNVFERTAVDLRDIASEAMRRRQDDLEGRELAIAADFTAEPCPVEGDPPRLRQALAHLIDNAVRFTPDGGRVDIVVRRDDDRVLLAVRDTGIGIPAGELDWIFDKVYEVGDVLHHSSGRLAFGSRGLGMGLALCKAIVEGHAGRLRVKSAVGLGSEFTIELPAGAAVPELVGVG
jgi:signal transduction histidine kinase